MVYFKEKSTITTRGLKWQHIRKEARKILQQDMIQ